MIRLKFFAALGYGLRKIREMNELLQANVYDTEQDLIVGLRNSSKKKVGPTQKW